MSDGLFYLALYCENCNAEIRSGLSMTTDFHNGHPIIPVDMGCQESYDCGNCGAVNSVGELDVYVDTSSCAEFERINAKDDTLPPGLAAVIENAPSPEELLAENEALLYINAEENQ